MSGIKYICNEPDCKSSGFYPRGGLVDDAGTQLTETYSCSKGHFYTKMRKGSLVRIFKGQGLPYDHFESGEHIYEYGILIEKIKDGD